MIDARYVLGIDTAARNGSIALAKEGRVLVSEPLPPGGHSSGLSDAARSLLRVPDLEFRDLAGIAVSEGPGSFTGLRIGLAWAKGFCMGSDLKLLLVSEHEAHAWLHRHERPMLTTVLPGERDHLQVSRWSGGERPRLLWGPESLPEREAWRACRGGVVIGEIRAPAEGADILEPGDAPTGAAVAELGHVKLLAGESADLARSAPAYGRAPNARKPAP